MNREVHVPDHVDADKSAIVADHVVFAGPGVVLHKNVRVDAASVIGENVTIGQGAWIRPGSVVLRSVPANAIVEGNPAEVVGYVNSDGSGKRSHPQQIDAKQFLDLDRPTSIPLDIGECRLYLMRNITDVRGSLTVGEIGKELPFIPARYFAVYDVPSMELRGEHAHKKCQQFLICLQGSCRVMLDDGESRGEITLDRPDIGIFMSEMIWGTQYRYSYDAVLMVFASRSYEADDYLRTYEDFLDYKQMANSK